MVINVPGATLSEKKVEQKKRIECIKDTEDYIR